MNNDKIVRIGGASGFWCHGMLGAPQRVNSGLIDHLAFNDLAETTMAILASVRARKTELGHATDFVDIAMKSVLPEVMRRGIQVVANAGGINPCGCAEALRLMAESQGLAPRIAADGSFVVGKPPGTGSVLLRAAVAGQILHEIGDPGAYLLADVGCDFRHVSIEQTGDARVRVSGARGFAPTNHYKVSTTGMAG